MTSLLVKVQISKVVAKICHLQVFPVLKFFSTLLVFSLPLHSCFLNLLLTAETISFIVANKLAATTCNGTIYLLAERVVPEESSDHLDGVLPN